MQKQPRGSGMGAIGFEQTVCTVIMHSHRRLPWAGAGACTANALVFLRMQALNAINTQNGVEIGGRRIFVREDREDRCVVLHCTEGGQCSWLA